MQDDLDDMVENDMETIRNAARNARGGGPTVGIGDAMEGIFWALALISVLGMLATMPFVGPDKAIPSRAWLGFSLLGILLFGGVALLMRLVRREINTGAVDNSIERNLRRKR